MHRTRLALLCITVAALAAATRLAAQPKVSERAIAVLRAAQPDCPRGTLPAYAHNDYTNTRPLHDALALGYKGVEADVFLIDGELRLGHDRRAAQRGSALEAKYLSPLRSLVARCGRLTADERPFLLNVELKKESRPAFDTLVALLGRYSELFTADSGQPPAVEVVLVGWSPPAVADDARVPLGRQVLLRRASGREGHAMDPAVRLISLDYGKTMGRWWVRRGGRQRWLSTLRAIKAAFPSRRIRVFDVPVNEQVYRELLAAGVDLIGTMTIAATARPLISAAGPVKDD